MSVEALSALGQRRVVGIAGLALLAACAPPEVGVGDEPRSGAGIEPTARARPEAAPAGVRPEPGPRSDSAAVPGVVVPRSSVEVSAPMAGRIASVEVDLGDRVERGSVLARLDTTAIVEDLRMAEASLAAVEAERQRAQAVLSQAEARWKRRLSFPENFSEEELEAARVERDAEAAAREAAVSRVEEQEARVRRLEADLDRAALKAPFTGTVARRHLDPGAAVAAGTPVVHLVTAEDLLIRFAVPPDQAAGLGPGEVVELHLPDGASSRAVIERVAPEVDPASQRIFVEATPTGVSGPAPGTALRVSPSPGVAGSGPGPERGG